MLGYLPIALAINGYGSIADNVGGISEMSYLNDSIRALTYKLDAAALTLTSFLIPDGQSIMKGARLWDDIQSFFLPLGIHICPFEIYSPITAEFGLITPGSGLIQYKE